VNIHDAVLYLVNNLVSTLLAFTVVAVFVGNVKSVGNAVKRFVFMELYAADEKHDWQLNNLEMQQLKQIICNRSLPDDDRIIAGDEYIKRGGNGEIKARYEALKRIFIAIEEQTEQEAK
jgi:hypothetical protein